MDRQTSAFVAPERADKRLTYPLRRATDMTPGRKDLTLGCKARDRDARTHDRRGRVDSLLMPILRKADVGIDAISAKFGISRWTLSRKPKAQGITF